MGGILRRLSTIYWRCTPPPSLFPLTTLPRFVNVRPADFRAKQESNMFSKQQTFNTVKEHLLKQNQPCVDDIFNCKYRHNGLKCAAGCLIPDDKYDPLMEDKTVDNKYFTDEDFFGHDKQLVLHLQDIHDHYSVKDWEKELRLLAEDEGLLYE